MREILFRGKDIKGNWHIGLLAHIGNAWYISNSAGVSTAFEVIPDTIGQYIGLTDKNSKKIFEGDIVKHYCKIYIGDPDFYNIMRIEWSEKRCRYRQIKNNSESYFVTNDNVFEIIGNIHDNPELLKGE